MLVRLLGSCCASFGFLRLWRPRTGDGIRDAGDEYDMPKVLLPSSYKAKNNGIMSCVVEEDEEEEPQRPSVKADPTIFKFDDVPIVTKQSMTGGDASLGYARTIDWSNSSVGGSIKSGLNNLLSLRNASARSSESSSYQKSFAGSTNVGNDVREADINRENARSHSDSNLTRRADTAETSFDLGSLTSLRCRLNVFLMRSGRKMLWAKENDKESNMQHR